MQKKILFLFFNVLFSGLFVFSQEPADSVKNDNLPVISYSSTPKTYTVAGIDVQGADNYDDFIIIGLSGLSVGEKVTIPGGDEISTAIKRFWRHGLFLEVQISATKIEGDQVWLLIDLKQRPRISEINYQGVKKSEREDLESRLGLVVGNQITPNIVDRAKIFIKRYFDEKGFKDAEVTIIQRPDNSKENQDIVDIIIDKKEKIKVNKIYIEGNSVLSDNKIKRTMKKTNEKGKLRNLFRSKKFVESEFENDQDLIIEKYQELGYRDAQIIKDSVARFDEKTVDVFLTIEEGPLYHIKSIQWVGNTLYPSEWLSQVLGLAPGDVYNQKKLIERLQVDEDAVANLYMNNGYLFFHIDPVEVNVENDSIDLEFRIREGTQATINKVEIQGNDRLYEHVIRRELYTKPGALYSREDIIRSLREIAQTQHFNPENMNPDIRPNYEDGTVDIIYQLESKSNDQVEFSLGWGQTGLVGRLGFRFANFSIRNLLNPSSYKGIIPQGEGQSLSISGQTNGRYYQSYSISFMDPWFGGKRPNTFSLGGYYSRYSSISSTYANNYYNYLYNSSYYDQSSIYSYADPNTSFEMIGVSVGLGKRLSWPDDYFSIYGELSFQQYRMKNWDYFIVQNGNCNNFSLRINFGRNSTDQPIYPRRGSTFNLSVALTPPYSLFDGKDYAAMTEEEAYSEKKYKWVEYHKWKFNSKTFTSLSSNDKLILMTRADFGLVGYYNKDKKSPFETFMVGGSGMSGYSSSYATETIALRGYEDSSLGSQQSAYTRLVLELRYPLLLEPTSTIYALAFLEGGNAWYDVKRFNPFDIKRAAGVGIRVMLPMIGLLGLDWAYGFDKINGSSSYGGSQLHFVLGQEF
ncbi:MAG: outer membrane protein assembly factor BamA [Candidatus Azobacteroides sp.]|nr:outer membrane protein assembly factor BamA [Candidatus Azobacteroides sp.]